MSLKKRMLLTCLACVALAGSGLASAPAQAATPGSCSYVLSTSAASKSATIDTIVCTQSRKVRAHVYWYSSSAGQTEYSTAGAWAGTSGSSNASFSSGVYSRGTAELN
jgi:hypothetical protein